MTAFEQQAIFEVSISKNIVIFKNNHYPLACTFDFGHSNEVLLSTLVICVNE